MRDFRKLIVWQRAHVLALDTHRALCIPVEKGWGATRNQLQRAITSIPANIAEGCGKRSDMEFARYLDIALGSAKEAENHLLFANDLGCLSQDVFVKLDAELTEIRRMLYVLARTVRLRAQMAGDVRREAEATTKTEARRLEP